MKPVFRTVFKKLAKLQETLQFILDGWQTTFIMTRTQTLIFQTNERGDVNLATVRYILIFSLIVHGQQTGWHTDREAIREKDYSHTVIKHINIHNMRWTDQTHAMKRDRSTCYTCGTCLIVYDSNWLVCVCYWFVAIPFAGRLEIPSFQLPLHIPNRPFCFDSLLLSYILNTDIKNSNYCSMVDEVDTLLVGWCWNGLDPYTMLRLLSHLEAS